MRQSEPLFRDTLFRGKRKRGGYQVVDPPQPALEALVADTHAHLEMLADVPLALARCAAHGLGFLCCVVDVCEGDLVVYDRAEAWRTEAQGLLGEILGDRGPCHTGPYNVSPSHSVYQGCCGLPSPSCAALFKGCASQAA